MEEKTTSKLIRFLGGKTSYYVVGLICLSALAIFLLRQIDFLFKPFLTIVLTVLPPLIFALVLYYLLNPLIRLLSKTKLSRGWAVGLVYLLILGMLGLGGVLLYPSVERQAMELVESLPQFFDSFQENARSLVNQTPFSDQLEQVFDSVNNWAKSLGNFASDYWQQGARGLGSFFSAVSTAAITLVTGPIIAFFLLKNPRGFYKNVMALVPPAFQRDARELVKTADEQLGAFLKGQVIASLILGAIYWVTFLVIGLRFSGILAIAAGILSIVPYVGSFLAFLPGLFVAAQDSLFMVVKFVIVWFVVQMLHGDLVVPRVMGDRLKIHPITILVVLLVMGDLLGLVGVIFGIPIYTLIKLLVVFSFRKFKKRYNRFYGEKGRYSKEEFSKKDYLDE